MWIYIKLAFRNMLRNKRRSLIAGTGMGLGLASLIFVDALMIGMERNMVETATTTFLGDGQIQQEEFRDTMQAELTINRFDQVIEQLKQEEAVKRFSARTMTYGTIASAANFSSVEIVGIDPASEQYLSEVDEAIIEGSYFEGDNARDIVIGTKLADLLEAGLGDRLVGTVAQAETGDLSQELFRVSGIFKFNITEMDLAMVFVRLPKAQQMLGIGKNAHAIVLDLDDPQLGLDDSYFLWEKYSEDGNECFGWAQILPQVKTAFALSRFSIYITGLILFGIVALGIINTLFMSLYERMFEFGVLRAIGTRPFSIGQMIVYEAAALAVLSIVLGSVLGLIITYATALVGFDFTGIEYVGVTFRRLIYPVLTARPFIEYPLWLFVFTTLIGLYPARYAAKLLPAEAMRRSL